MMINCNQDHGLYHCDLANPKGLELLGRNQGSSSKVANSQSSKRVVAHFKISRYAGDDEHVQLQLPHDFERFS